MNVEAILKSLPTLSEAELKRISDRIVALRVTASKPVEDDDWLFAGIVWELRRRGVLAPSSRPPVRSTTSFAPKYPEEAKDVRKGLLAGINFKPRSADLYALGALAARALADDLEGGPAPICLQVMLQNTHRMLGAVDKSYPNYLRCGLLGHLLQPAKERKGSSRRAR